MGINLRYGPMDWNRKTGKYDFDGAGVTGITGTNVYGKEWFVDVTNGNNGNDGLTPNKAFATIQKAIDVHTADRAALLTGYKFGNRINVMPGVYAEGLTGTLTGVSLVGVGGNWGNGPNACVIYPASASGLSNITTNQARISGFTFVSPSTSTTLPAVHFANMRWTTFDNNALIGGAAACITGLQIGNEDGVATAAACDFNRISNNYFGTVFGTSYQFQYGIKIGMVGYDAGASVKSCHSTIIENNNIFAAVNGIYLGVYGGKANGTIIDSNNITSWEAGDDEGCSSFAVQAYTATYAMCVNNRCAVADAASAFSGFQAGHLIGNWSTQDGVGKYEAAIA